MLLAVGASHPADACTISREASASVFQPSSGKAPGHQPWISLWNVKGDVIVKMMLPVRSSPSIASAAVNYGTSRLLGATAENMQPMVGDILLAQESVTPGTSGLFRLQWNGTALLAVAVPLDPTSATVGQWEHVTLAGAKIAEIQ